MIAAMVETTTTRKCHENGCLQSTREGKPYCSKHVERHSYVQGILDTLAERHAEEERVRRQGADAVDPNGLTARELCLHLSLHGARTVERLCRELQLEAKVIEAYLGELARLGRVVTSRTNRGSTVVTLAA